MLLDASKASLLVIDIQERLLPAMAEPERVTAKTGILLTAARELGLPITISEQYPKGLGRTVPALAANDAVVFEKTAFSCWRDAEMKKHFIKLHEGGRPLVVVAGIESHVCVLQTCVDLYNSGFGVFAVTDAMSSRQPAAAELAYTRLGLMGVEVVNTEMALFELLEKAGTPQFKALSPIIR